MAIVEVNISILVDGLVTGPNINEHPGLGEGGEILYGWLAEGDSQEVLYDNLFDPTGAVITSRKVFDGTGGWGEDGFYRMPVFVLTHRAWVNPLQLPWSCPGQGQAETPTFAFRAASWVKASPPQP